MCCCFLDRESGGTHRSTPVNEKQRQRHQAKLLMAEPIQAVSTRVPMKKKKVEAGLPYMTIDSLPREDGRRRFSGNRGRIFNLEDNRYF